MYHKIFVVKYPAISKPKNIYNNLQEIYMIKVITVKPKLLDQVRHATRVRHLSYRTEQAYVHWIKRFILFHNKRHPSEMD